MKQITFLFLSFSLFMSFCRYVKIITNYFREKYSACVLNKADFVISKASCGKYKANWNIEKTLFSNSIDAASKAELYFFPYDSSNCWMDGIFAILKGEKCESCRGWHFRALWQWVGATSGAGLPSKSSETKNNTNRWESVEINVTITENQHTQKSS